MLYSPLSSIFSSNLKIFLISLCDSSPFLSNLSSSLIDGCLKKKRIKQARNKVNKELNRYIILQVVLAWSTAGPSASSGNEKDSTRAITNNPTPIPPFCDKPYAYETSLGIVSVSSFENIAFKMPEKTPQMNRPANIVDSCNTIFKKLKTIIPNIIMIIR